MPKSTISLLSAATLVLLLSACSALGAPGYDLHRGDEERNMAEGVTITGESTEYELADVELAVGMLSQYTQKAYSNTHLLNTSWAAEGYPVDYILDDMQLAVFLTESAQSDLTDLVTARAETGESPKLQSYVQYVNELTFNKELAPSPDCSGENADEPTACLQFDPPIVYDWTYSDGENGSLTMSTGVLPIVIKITTGGQMANITYEYRSLTFHLVKNQADSGPTFLIDSVESEGTYLP